MNKKELKHHLCAFGCCELVRYDDDHQGFLAYRCQLRPDYIGLSDCSDCKKFVDWREHINKKGV